MPQSVPPSFFRLPVIAVRVSGGHLCGAEAPTEPAGETAARRVSIRLPCSLSLRGALAPRQSVSLLRVLRILSCSALRMTYRLVIASTVRCAAIRFPFFKNFYSAKTKKANAVQKYTGVCFFKRFM